MDKKICLKKYLFMLFIFPQSFALREILFSSSKYSPVCSSLSVTHHPDKNFTINDPVSIAITHHWHKTTSVRPRWPTGYKRGTSSCHSMKHGGNISRFKSFVDHSHSKTHHDIQTRDSSSCSLMPSLADEHPQDFMKDTRHCTS